MGAEVTKLVHESETQRQFVRVHLPARITIDHKNYDVTDLSSGGLSFKDPENTYRKGQVFELLLVLPFPSFSMDVSLNVEVVHTSPTKETVGCRFTDLSSDQLAVLHHVLRSFIAGEIVVSNDLLNTVSRENFVKMRGQSQEELKSGFWRKQIIPLLFIVALGSGAFWLIAQNVYQGMFIIESAQAHIAAPTISLRAPQNGYFQTDLDVTVSKVSVKQDFGKVRSEGRFLGSTGELSVVVESPCDCYIEKLNVQNGEYVPEGFVLANLVKADSPVSVDAIVPTKDALRMKIGKPADIRVGGGDIVFTGVIDSMDINNLPVPMEGSLDTGTRVIVKPDQKLPVELVGRPAKVIFKR